MTILALLVRIIAGATLAILVHAGVEATPELHEMVVGWAEKTASFLIFIAPTVYSLVRRRLTAKKRV